MDKIHCPECSLPINVKKDDRWIKCPNCGISFRICDKSYCRYCWVPRKKDPKECPMCKRYLKDGN